MAKVNVYLPDDLAAMVRASEMNVSKVCQDALRLAVAGAVVRTVVRQRPEKVKTLRCALCRDIWDRGPRITELRRWAHAYGGWRHWQRRDYCPDCWRAYTLAPRAGEAAS